MHDQSHLFIHHEVSIAPHVGGQEENNSSAEREQRAKSREQRADKQRAESREQRRGSKERAASNHMVQDSRRLAGRQRELDRLQQHDRAASRKHACYHGWLL